MSFYYAMIEALPVEQEEPPVEPTNWQLQQAINDGTVWLDEYTGKLAAGLIACGLLQGRVA